MWKSTGHSSSLPPQNTLSFIQLISSLFFTTSAPLIALYHIFSGQVTQSSPLSWTCYHMTGSIRESFLCRRLIFHELVFLTSELAGIFPICVEMIDPVFWTLLATSPIHRYYAKQLSPFLLLKITSCQFSFSYCSNVLHKVPYLYTCQVHNVFSVHSSIVLEEGKLWAWKWQRGSHYRFYK